MRPLLIALPGNEALAAMMTAHGIADLAHVEFRRFPDDETYVRQRTDLSGRSVIVLCTLDRPDSKLLPLLFAADTARALGAARVGLIAPYLAYMRQDKRFKDGEAVTSTIFARLLSSSFDWLVTVDPHLHRLPSLGAIYSIPARALHAAPLLANWIAREVAAPLLIGPDAESEQWVRTVAEEARAPYLVLQKTRRGDFAVDVSLPDMKVWRDRTPVLVDDIISTARTMIETVNHLKRAGMRPPVCVGVHAVFSSGSYDALRAAGPRHVVTTNTIAHESNVIDVSPLLAESAKQATA